MRYAILSLSLLLFMNTSFADTLRDFTKNGIFIDTGDKKIPSKRLQYGMEIDFGPSAKTQSVKVGLYDKNGQEVILATVPTSTKFAACYLCHGQEGHP